MRRGSEGSKEAGELRTAESCRRPRAHVEMWSVEEVEVVIEEVGTRFARRRLWSVVEEDEVKRCWWCCAADFNGCLIDVASKHDRQCLPGL